MRMQFQITLLFSICTQNSISLTDRSLQIIENALSAGTEQNGRDSRFFAFLVEDGDMPTPNLHDLDIITEPSLLSCGDS